MARALIGLLLLLVSTTASAQSATLGARRVLETVARASSSPAQVQAHSGWKYLMTALSRDAEMLRGLQEDLDVQSFLRLPPKEQSMLLALAAPADPALKVGGVDASLGNAARIVTLLSSRATVATRCSNTVAALNALDRPEVTFSPALSEVEILDLPAPGPLRTTALMFGLAGLRQRTSTERPGGRAINNALEHLGHTSLHHFLYGIDWSRPLPKDMRALTQILQAYFEATGENPIHAGILGTAAMKPRSWRPPLLELGDLSTTSRFSTADAVPNGPLSGVAEEIWRERGIDRFNLFVANYFPDDYPEHDAHWYSPRVYRLKRQQDPLIAKEIADHYAPIVLKHFADAPIDMVINTPSSKAGRPATGMLADAIATALKVPFVEDVLENTPGGRTSQKKVRGNAARILNTAETFLVPGNVKGKHILLVDDNISTGVTLDELRRVLLDAGAATVRTLSFGKAPMDRGSSALPTATSP